MTSQVRSVGSDATSGVDSHAERQLPRVLAFYLPQYHPIPENDEWWGSGFTEWTNVAKARPRFPGHYQPHVPADLGFYDLRVPETRALQASLAQRFGVSAFVYWHYWFGHGRRLLERPFQEVLESGEPRFPLCLGWANQTWTGVWHGTPNRVLIEQSYPGDDDHRRHFDAVLPAFLDDRYFTVNGLPLFYVLAPTHIPEVAKFLELWRRRAEQAGLPGLYLVAAGGSDSFPDAREFDGQVAHVGPDIHLPPRDYPRRIARKVGVPPTYSFRRFSDRIPGIADHRRSFPCALAGWDNSPRSGARGVVLHGTAADAFRGQIERATAQVQGYPADEQLVFVKSWNEWAEGNHLEPDQRHGAMLLNALRDGLTQGCQRSLSGPAKGPGA